MHPLAAVIAIPSLAAVALAVGCSSSDPATGGASGSGAAGSAGDASAPDAAWSCAQDSQLALTGTWAVLLDLQLNLTSQTGGVATLCPEQQTDRATIMMALQVQQAQGGTALDSIQPVFCSIELPALQANVGECDPASNNKLMVDLLLSGPLQAALGSIASGKVAGSLDGAAPGAGFLADRMRLTAGTRKLGADMPSWLSSQSGCGMADTAAGRGAQCESKCVDDCAAMVDDDNDGRTGVSFHVCGYSADDKTSGLKCNAENPSDPSITIQGPLFMDFQVDPLLQGKAVSSCEVRGAVDAQVIYHVVGGDMYVANTQIAVLSAMRSLPLFTVDASQSRFRMVRIDGTHGAPDWKADPAAPCSVVLQHKNDLR